MQFDLQFSKRVSTFSLALYIIWFVDEAPAESKKSKTEESNLSPEIEASGNRRPTKRGK